MTDTPKNNMVAGANSVEPVDVDGRFEPGSLTEAGWTVSQGAASKPAESERFSNREGQSE